jgi:GT2 family glycosyltransferase
MRKTQNFVVRDGQKSFSTKPEKSETTIYKMSTAPADLCIIIPVFERAELETSLHYCEKSLAAANRRASIVIVDQTLTKMTLAKIQECVAALADSPWFTNVLFHHDASYTISGAKNYGLRLARERLGTHGIGEYVIFLDSDVYLHPRTIAELLTTGDANKQVGAFSFPVTLIRSQEDMTKLHIDDSASPPSYQAIDSFYKPEPEILRFSVQDAHSSLLYTPAIHGCFFAIRTAILESDSCFMLFFGMHGEHVELCARLRDRGHAMAYIMHVPIFHDDRPTVTHSVMRNLADREQYIVATIVVMMARNSIHKRRRDEKSFLDLVRRKWLTNLKVDRSEAKAVTSLLTIIGGLLHTHYPNDKKFASEAHTIIEAYRGSDKVKQFLRQGIDYICRNSALLLPLFLDKSTKQPLYSLSGQTAMSTVANNMG